MGRRKLSFTASFCVQPWDHCVLSAPGWPWDWLTGALTDSSHRGLHLLSRYKAVSGTCQSHIGRPPGRGAVVPAVGEGWGSGVMDGVSVCHWKLQVTQDTG